MCPIGFLTPIIVTLFNTTCEFKFWIIFLNAGGTGPEDSDYRDPEITDPHFSGCMRNLHLNGLFYPLSTTRGWKGWAIDDCDGTACGGEVSIHNKRPKS